LGKARGQPMWINIKAILVIAAILVTIGWLRDAAAHPGSTQVNHGGQATARVQNMQSAQVRSLSEASLRSVAVGF
jgi:hypothetical protein